MSVHTHAPRTHAVCTLTFTGPALQAEAARQALAPLGFTDASTALPWREVLPPIPEGEQPGRMLRAARHKEGVTQRQLAQMVGLPQRHISEMEHGKRPIGKARARQLATVLHIDYRILL